MNTKAQKNAKNVPYLGSSDNRKSDFIEKPKAFAIFNYFIRNFENRFIIALGPYQFARILE